MSKERDAAVEACNDSYGDCRGTSAGRAGVSAALVFLGAAGAILSGGTGIAIGLGIAALGGFGIGADAADREETCLDKFYKCMENLPA